MRLAAAHGDAIAGLAFLGFTAYLYVDTVSMPAQAARYPFLLEAIFGISAIALLARSIVRLLRSNSGPQIFSGIAWRRLIAITVVWLLAIASLRVVGFYASVALMIMMVAWLIEAERTSVWRRVQLVIFGATGAFALWSIFSLGLNVVTPRGWLF